MPLGKGLSGVSKTPSACILGVRQSMNRDNNKTIRETLHKDLQALLSASRILRNVGKYLPNYTE